MATIPLDIVANTKDAVRAIKRLEVQSKDSFGGITGAIGKLSIGITGLNQGFQLASAGARVLADGLAATVGQALEFEESIAEISTLLNDATVGTEQLGKTVLDLQKQFGGNQKVIAGAFYNAISSGAVEAGNANLFLADANKLAVGGVTDLDTAVDGLTTIISGFGLKAQDTKEISDSLFIAMQKGKTTVGELSRGVGIAAASASSLGVDFKELLAATSALTTGGITTSVAFTQVRSALVGLSKPSAGLQKILNDLKITSIETAISQDGMVGTLKKIIAQTDGSAEAMSQLFGSVEAVQGVTALTSDVIGGTFQDALKQMETASKNSGATTETAFQKIADTAKFQFDKLKGIVSASFTEIGSEVTKRITPVLKTLQSVAGTLGTAFKKGVAAASKAFASSKLFKADSIGKTILKSINLGLKGFNLLQKAIVATSKTVLDLAITFTKFGGVTFIVDTFTKAMILGDSATTKLAKTFAHLAGLKAFLTGDIQGALEFARVALEAEKHLDQLAFDLAAVESGSFDGLAEGLELARDGIVEVGDALTVAIDATTDSLEKGIINFGKATSGISTGAILGPELPPGFAGGADAGAGAAKVTADVKAAANQGAEFGKSAIGIISKGKTFGDDDQTAIDEARKISIDTAKNIAVIEKEQSLLVVAAQQQVVAAQQEAVIAQKTAATLGSKTASQLADERALARKAYNKLLEEQGKLAEVQNKATSAQLKAVDESEKSAAKALAVEADIRAGIKQANIDGAKALIVSVSDAVGKAFGIPFLGPILELLMTDGVVQLITGIIDALPLVISNLAEAIPQVAVALAVAMSDPLFQIKIINAVIDGFTKGIDKVAKKFVEDFQFATGEGFVNFRNEMSGFAVSIREGFNQIWNDFADNFIKGWVPVRDAILGPFQAIERILHGIVNKVTEFFNRISGSEAGGAVSKAGSDIKDFVGLAGGGIVPSGFNDDTFPARLTSGEAVIKRDTTEELANFLDRQGGVEALLAQLVEIVSRPMTVQSSVEVDGQAFADINLELSRTGARTA